MWGMRPGETQPMPEAALHHNAPLFEASAVVNPAEVERLALGGAGIPGLAELWPRIPRWVIRADLGRLLFVYAHGGFYCDVDCELQRPLPPLSPLSPLSPLPSPPLPSGEQPACAVVIVECHVLLDTLGPRECKDPAHTLRVANFAFGASAPRNPFIRAVLDECVRRLAELLDDAEADGDVSDLDIIWVCGPDVITTVYHRRAHVLGMLGLSAQEANAAVLLLDKSAAQHKAHGAWRGEEGRRSGIDVW